MADRPALSVIIACTRARAVLRTLGGLAAQDRPERMEVWLVGESPLHTRAWPFALEVIPCAEEHPNTRRNLALAGARAPRIAFLDDDTEPLAGWLDAACRLPEDALVVRTGPELPARESRGARLAHAVLASPFGEIGSGHHHETRGPLAWYRVPFSNLVTTRTLWDRLGALPADVPWDCDDFELCARARQHARFEADPALVVRHDRYPDSERELLAGIWKRRLRTGEKLVEAPGLYWRVPPVVACALVPLAATVPGALPLACLVYGLALARATLQAGGSIEEGLPLRFAALMVGVHATSVLGVQCGLARALGQRARARRAGRPRSCRD